jgi:nucleoside-diphosphate-sugar epimerase
MSRVVLVDGAAGFLGWAVVSELVHAGFRVRATDRPGSALPIGEGIEPVHADLETDALAPLFAGVTHAVHVAGLFDLAATKEALTRANVTVAARVAEAALAAKVARFVHVSSVTVHGRPSASPIREDAPMRGGTPYEVSKREGELAVAAIASRRLPFVIVRPSGIYGPRGRYGLSAAMATMVLAKAKGRGHRSLRGGPRMTHVHVEDVARAIALVLDTPVDDVSGRAFFVADETPIRWGELFAFLEEELGVEPRAPFELSWLRARLAVAALRLTPRARLARTNDALASGWGRLVRENALVPALTPRVDPHAYDYFLGDHVYDTSALKALGFRAKYPDPREGLRETIAWYRRERWLPEL